MNKEVLPCARSASPACKMGFPEALKTLGRVLMMEIGGSMGPLYGTMFSEMARAIKGPKPWTRRLLGRCSPRRLRG